MQALMRFVGVLPQERPTQPHVALVYAVGNVIDGHGDGIIGARMQIASRTLSSTLRALQRDETVKAVVLRVDSPGGSALASEQIARAVADLKAVKPVVVSMGTLAASGGYYISAGATKIFATPNTLTGSIGVVGGKLALGKGLARLGIDTYSVTRGKHAGLWSVTTVWSKEERELVLALMKQTYDLFVNHVAEGRGKTSEEIDAVAQGRIWTGKAALEAGLVDELGGLHAALSEAHRLAGLDPTTQLEIYPPKPTLQDLLESSGGFPLAQVYGATWDELAARALGAVSPDMESIVRSMLERLAMLDAHPVLVTDFALHG